MTRHVYAYPSSLPLPQRSRTRARVIGLAACVTLGAVIGWYWGGREPGVRR